MKEIQLRVWPTSLHMYVSSESTSAETKTEKTYSVHNSTYIYILLIYPYAYLLKKRVCDFVNIVILLIYGLLISFVQRIVPFVDLLFVLHIEWIVLTKISFQDYWELEIWTCPNLSKTAYNCLIFFVHAECHLARELKQLLIECYIFFFLFFKVEEFRYAC